MKGMKNPKPSFSTRWLFNGLVFFLFVLAFPAPAFSQTLYLYTGQSGAQTQIDVDHATRWNISITSGSIALGGARLTMKKGPNSAADVLLQVYSGTSAIPANLLASRTRAVTSFTQSFEVVEFAFASPIVLTPGQYFITTSTAAADQQNVAYFIKG